MLLSRMAEAVYWTGRYLERAESTARIVRCHTELFLDLPRAAGVTWEALLAVTGSSSGFRSSYPEAGEENVVAFLTADARNSGSVVSSLSRARENLRTTRSLFPREAYEAVNQLYLTMAEAADQAVPRRSRGAWTDEVVREVQRTWGLLAGTMSHDEAYSFLQIGQHVERADMTARVLDVRAASLLVRRDDDLRSYAEVQWMSVLKSLSAHQMYRRKVHTSVQGPEALRFLLQDPQFPRSVEHCLTVIGHRLLEVPRHERPMAVCARAQRTIEEARVRTLAWDGLTEFVDGLQLALADFDASMTETYFRAPAGTQQAMMATA